MSPSSRWIRKAALGLLAGLSAACGDAHRADISEKARAWVDRLHDTTTVQAADSLPADSAYVDSLASTFTTDDWLMFWHEVEKEKARRTGK